jgi:hypothetical protein
MSRRYAEVHLALPEGVHRRQAHLLPHPVTAALERLTPVPTSISPCSGEQELPHHVQYSNPVAQAFCHVADAS